MPARINHMNAVLRLTMAAVGEGRVAGRVAGEMLPAPLYFSDLGQLVLSLDAVFDRRNFPQAFQRARRFSPSAPAPTLETASLPLPKNAEELTLSVLSRRSSSWQGVVIWDDGTRVSFPSTLALIRLLSEHFGI